MKRLLIFLVMLLSACGGAASQSTNPSVPTSAANSVSTFKATVSGAVSGDVSGTGTTFKQSEGGLLITLLGTQGLSGAAVTGICAGGSGGDTAQ